MKYLDWNEEKNNILKRERNISFEEIELAIANGGLIETILHPNQDKYPGQKLFFVNINNYIYTVPFIEDKNKIFLKTIYPDRIATKIFLGEKK
ncbi:MAG: DUF4258 domain-containing protein [FCB group bacterium]|jgi:uncharacterized DUF497 family protein